MPPTYDDMTADYDDPRYTYDGYLVVTSHPGIGHIRGTRNDNRSQMPRHGEQITTSEGEAK